MHRLQGIFIIIDKGLLLHLYYICIEHTTCIGVVQVDSSVLERVLGVSNKDHTSWRMRSEKINAMQISTKGKRDLGMHTLLI